MATHTRTFGTGKRESHDSSAFYKRFETPEFSKLSECNDIPPTYLDQIYCQSSENMSQLPDNSVALMVTSPPYHVGRDYDTDDTFDEYLALLHRIFTETDRVLQPGGRAAINLANLGRKPYIPLTTLVDNMCLDIGWFPRGQIVWIKAEGASGSCAWGSWQSPANPSLRDLHEMVLVYSKGRMDRIPHGRATISKEDFMRDTLSVWKIPPASAKKVGHPAPFPEELPSRLINLYTYEHETVLDPFMGAGATAIAALRLDRHYVGYDTDLGYVARAYERLDEERNRSGTS